MRFALTDAGPHQMVLSSRRAGHICYTYKKQSLSKQQGESDVPSGGIVDESIKNIITGPRLRAQTEKKVLVKGELVFYEAKIGTAEAGRIVFILVQTI